jgi:hypothetical protein
MATYMDGIEGGKHNSDDCEASFYLHPKRKKPIVKNVTNYHFFISENGKAVKKQFTNRNAALISAREHGVTAFFDENAKTYTV